jgi:uncharacterized repeat protein (TIGR04076 family)
MKKVKITVMRTVRHDDLIAAYENPMEHPCDMRVGQVFIANGWNRPEGLCLSAWESMSPFVMTLAHGGTNIYNGWMKNPRSAMISCNDGFRPVSFLLEALNEEATISNET